MIPTEPVIGVREAARRLRVHENTVRNWSDEGLLHPIKLPGSGYRRFREEEVDEVARYLEGLRALEKHGHPRETPVSWPE